MSTANSVSLNIKAASKGSFEQGGEDDLDALLAKFVLEDKIQTEAAIEDKSMPPSARVYSSFTPVAPNQVVSCIDYLPLRQSLIDGSVLASFYCPS